MHDFCFQYNYLWAVQGNQAFKFKQGNGFFKWSALIRQVGIQRNELRFIDYFTWLMGVCFGWINWLSFQRREKQELVPDGLIIKHK